MYPVTKIFHSLQGEGHFVGYPMVFVRLAGCSVLDCHIRAECDEAPWKATERLEATVIAARAASLSPGGIACITGGEPTDHDLVPLVASLRDVGMRVHMETSGLRPVTGYPLEWLTVSPKVRGATKQKTGHTLKIVVRHDSSDEDAWGAIEEHDNGSEFFHRYLQPTSLLGIASNTEQVVRMLLSERNVGGRWALSVQAHRNWGLP